MTSQQKAFTEADDVAERVRLAADVARQIVTRGLAAAPDDGLTDHEDDVLVMNWLGLLAGSQPERLTDHNLKVTADWDAIEHLASMAYSMGLAVGLRQRLEAYEGAPSRSKSKAGGGQ